MAIFEKKKKGFNIKRATEAFEFDSKYMYPLDCAPIDIALGGGLLSGKIYEFYGKKGSAKSTFALEATKSFTNYWKDKKQEYRVLWIESESSLDRFRAKYMGCDLDNYEIGIANTVEEGFEMIDFKMKEYSEANIRSIVVWDTIAAAPTAKQKESENMFIGGIGEKPRVISNALPRIINLIGGSDSCLILVNQVYNVVGAYVPTIESKGGESIKFFASVRVELKARKDLCVVEKNGNERKIGIIAKMYTEKNKLTLEGQTCMINVYGESGIDKIETTINSIKAQFKNTDNDFMKVAGAGWTTFIDVPALVLNEAKNKDIKFQSMKDLKNDILIKYPMMKDYIDYIVYKYCSDSSPLLKIRLIDKLWAYEKAFYKEKRTTLTEQEQDAANMKCPVKSSKQKDTGPSVDII